jgi:hypothetical protein
LETKLNDVTLVCCALLESFVIELPAPFEKELQKTETGQFRAGTK